MTRIEAIKEAYDLFDRIKAYEVDEFTALLIARELAAYIRDKVNNSEQSNFYYLVYRELYNIRPKD
jgi:hypothetical protein